MSKNHIGKILTNEQIETMIENNEIDKIITIERSVEGVNIYAVTKSCLSTYAKNNINLYQAVIPLLNSNPILI